MSAELKPCPFCGGKAEQCRGGRYAYQYYVMCVDCGSSSRGSAFKNDNFNATEWNKRDKEPT
jgi:Lar family restriction alleviation protein